MYDIGLKSARTRGTNSSRFSFAGGRVQREDVLAAVREVYECIGQADRCLHGAASVDSEAAAFLPRLTSGAAPFQVGEVQRI
jgi:hypothetical protein